MFKTIIIFLFIAGIATAQSYQFTFTDTLNGKPVQRIVGTEYPLPVEIRLTADTTKSVMYNNGVMTVPFPIKLY